MKKHLFFVIILLFFLSGCAGSQKTGEDPVGGVVDDSTITTRVNHEMLKDDVVKARQIDVDTIGGHVTLIGVVKTREESARAVQIARNVPAVRSVTNNIQIGERKFGDIWTDNVISNKIKAKLIAEPEVRSTRGAFSQYRCRRLSGGGHPFRHCQHQVPEGSEKDRAIQISRATDGTVKVIDNLKVQ
jgi:hyperosmotically inducible protein